MTTTVTIAVNEFTASGPVALLGHSITFKPVPIHIDSTTDTVLSEDIWEVAIVDGVSTTLIPDSVSGYGVRIGANIQGWKFVTVANYPVGTISLADLVNNYAVNPITLEPTPAPDSWWTALANLVDNSVSIANQYTDEQLADFISGVTAQVAAAVASANGYTDTKTAAALTSANGYTDGKVAGEVTRSDAAYAPIGDLAFSTLELALAATPSGGVLEIRKAWSRATTFTVNKAVTLRFRGGSITQTADTPAITITANDVSIEAPVLTGLGGSTSGTGAAISSVATVGSPRSGIRIVGGIIDGWRKYGIYLEQVTDFWIERVTVKNIAYGAIMVLSGFRGIIRANSVLNVIQPTGFVNSYGIALTRSSAQNLTDAPRSDNILVDNNIVDGVTNWEGIDTHGGTNLIISNNVVRNVFIGIAMVPCPDTSGNDAYAPLGIIIKGNSVESGKTDGSARAGIQLIGCLGATVDTVVEYATGVITNNKVVGFGVENSSNQAAVFIQATKGSIIANNRVVNSSPVAIGLTNNNQGTMVLDNELVDTWTTGTSFTACVYVSSAHQSVVVRGNRAVRADKTATLVNQRGLFIAAALTTDIAIQYEANHFKDCTIPIVDSPTTQNFTEQRMEARKLSFFPSVPPVTRRTLPVAATDATTTQTLANALRQALIDLGLGS